jgi:hypothetical protein
VLVLSCGCAHAAVQNNSGRPCYVYAATSAALLLQMNYNNKNNLVGALLVAGYDKHNGGQVGTANNIHNNNLKTRGENG